MMQGRFHVFTVHYDAIFIRLYIFSTYRTVWYELLCGEWPHKGLPPEAIIWQVGRGMKPSLAHLQASRDVKVSEKASALFDLTLRKMYMAN